VIGTTAPAIGLADGDCYRVRDLWSHDDAHSAGDVGPVVVPGATGCLRCRDLARADADAAWPALVAGLREVTAVDVPTALGAPLAAVTAALAVARAVAYVDGAADPAPDHGLLLGPTGVLVGRYRIVAHPRCGCTWDPATVTMAR
jgi:bacteriocin biosynthesis cyclodehydratase domain-containing protein